MLRSPSVSPSKSTASLRTLLIGSSLAGLASFGIGAAPANAAPPNTPCSFGTNKSADACVKDATYDSTLPSDKQIKLVSDPLTGKFGPSAGNGTVDFDYINIPPLSPLYGVEDLWEVDVDFDEDLIGPVVDGTFKYEIKIDPKLSLNSFNTVRLDVDALRGLPSVRKTIYSDDLFTNQIGQLFVEGDGNATLILPPNLQTLYVRDTYNVPDGAVLNAFQNTYTQVPGPLPVLGAGAAFGFSRRLRRRVRQRHSLG